MRVQALRFLMMASAVVVLALVLPPDAGAHGGDPSLVHACVHKSSQHVRIVAPEEACQSNEAAVHWAAGEADVTSEPLTLTVDCAAGEKVADALALAVHSTNRVTVTVEGTCKEAVTINRDGITLQGAAAGDGLEAPAPTSTVLTVLGQRIVLNQLTITGGFRGVAALRGASYTSNGLTITGASSAGLFLFQGAAASVANVVIESMGRNGVEAILGGTLNATNLRVTGAPNAGVWLVQSSSATLNNCTIEGSPRDGLELGLGASAAVVGGTIRNNSIGIHAESGAHVVLVGGTLVENNTFRGGLAGTGGSISLQGGTVKGGDFGLQAFTGATVVVTGGASVVRDALRFGLFADGGRIRVSTDSRIVDNGGGGVLVTNGGSAFFQTRVLIENNGGPGVDVFNSTVSFAATSPNVADGIVVRNNAGHGVALHDTSVARFFPVDGAPTGSTTITGNGGFGVVCDGPPAVAHIAGFPGTITGNASGNVACALAP